MSEQWPTGDLLHARVQTTPNRPVLTDESGNRELAGADLDAHVDAVAAGLPDVVGPGDRVGLLCDTRFEFAVLAWAIRRRGAIVAPLNVRLAEAEITDRLSRLDPVCLVCEAETAEVADSVASVPVVSIDSDDPSPVPSLTPVPNATLDRTPVKPSDVATIVFTSGTTGTPTAVKLTVKNLLWSALGSALRLGVSPDDRWLCCLPMYHTGGLMPVFRSALYGSTLVIQRNFSPDTTATVIADQDCTGVSLVPTMLSRLIESGWNPPAHLDTVLVGGARSRPPLLEQARKRDIPVHPTYGMTETASQVATARPADVDIDPETVGYPLLPTAVTIVNEEGAPVGADTVGEIVVDGPTVSPGFLEESVPRSQYGMRTGDLGQWTDAGRLRIVGRVDDLISTGGETVAPESVRQVLESHPAVQEAAIVGIPDETWGERVGAMVVASDTKVDETALEAHCREELAGFAVPRVWAFTGEIPRTASGTIDRDAVTAHLSENGQV